MKKQKAEQMLTKLILKKIIYKDNKSDDALRQYIKYRFNNFALNKSHQEIKEAWIQAPKSMKK